MKFTVVLLFSLLAFIINISMVFVFTSAMERKGANYAKKVLGVFGLFAVLEMIVIWISYLNQLPGPELILTPALCIALPLAFIIFVANLQQLRRFKKLNLEPDRILFYTGNVVIIFLQIIPTIFSFQLEGYCDRALEDTGKTLIIATNQFYDEHGAYPKNLSELVPAYVEKIPDFQCFKNTDPVSTFRIFYCDNNHPLLVTKSFNGWQYVRYDFQTEGWSYVSVMDDDECFMLE